MSENEMKLDQQEENYERDKANYDVADYYDTPSWYKKFLIWLWPMICIWAFITLTSAPEYRLVSSLGYGAAVLGFQIMAWLMRRCWPVSIQN